MRSGIVQWRSPFKQLKRLWYRYYWAAVSMGIAALITVPSLAMSPSMEQGQPPAATQSPEAIAQSATSDSGRRYSFYNAWRLVYERLPDFPLENQYIELETGDPAENNTLADRLIRYHVFVKNRPPNSRLDWKFTLADYLGVNEPMLAYQYPGSDSLETNPLSRDMEIVSQFDRQQRNELVEVMVSIFSLPGDAPDAGSDSASPATPDSTPPPVLNGPGAADLLEF